jgi:hypothetical protein
MKNKKINPLAHFVSVILLLFVFLFPSAIANGEPINSKDLGKAVIEIENLTEMRSQLASYLKDSTDPVTPETFKEVCQPVGMRSQRIGKENGWKVKQIASKYRNPDHKPNLPEQIALAQFNNNPELNGFWQEDSVNGEKGLHYFRRINVEGSCLACHGAKNDRPEFIINKYTQDLAYDFKEGDLRGMYSVFIPELKQALENIENSVGK